MSKYFIFLIILATSYAKSSAKGDTQGSAKSEEKDDTSRFAAPLSEQDNARTHLFPWKQHLYPQKYPPPHDVYGYLPGGFISYFHNKFQKPSFFQKPPFFQKPSFFHPSPVAPAPVHPVHPVQHIPTKPITPIFTVPSVPVHTEPVYIKPSMPAVPFYPSIVPEQPSGPVITKPTYVVSQQVIHKPVLAETIEVVRRPVVTEFVEKVHKPVIHEELQVIKIPTYIEHVVKKPHVAKPISNELVGEPIYLPSQHFTFHEKPLPTRPVTTQVYQIPHQSVPNHGSVGYGSAGYDVGFSSIKPSNSFGSSYGGISTSYGTPSYSFSSSYGGVGPGYTLGPGYGVGTSYPVPSYNFGSNYGGVGTSYAVPSYNFGSNYGGVGSSYGKPGYNLGSGYGGGYNYGFGGAGIGYAPSGGVGASFGGYGGENEGVAHTFVEPAPSCKQSGGCKPSKNEELDYERGLPSYWPQMWYNTAAPQYMQPKANLVDDEYDADIVYPYYFPFSEDAADVQTAKVREFLEDPSTRAQLLSMLQNFVERNATPSQNLDDDKPPTGRSSYEDTSEADSAVEVNDDDKTVKTILDQMRNLSPEMLKKFEDGLRDLRANIAKNISPKTDVQIKSTESTSTLPTTQST